MQYDKESLYIPVKLARKEGGFLGLALTAELKMMAQQT